MPEIVLSTLNAKYIHASFGLRYLFANLGELRDRACIVEFDINQRVTDIAERSLGSASTSGTRNSRQTWCTCSKKLRPR